MRELTGCILGAHPANWASPRAERYSPIIQKVSCGWKRHQKYSTCQKCMCFSLVMKYSQVSGVNYARNRRQLSAGSSLELIHNPKKNLIPAVYSGVIKKKKIFFPYLTGVPAAIQVHQRSLPNTQRTRCGSEEKQGSLNCLIHALSVL